MVKLIKMISVLAITAAALGAHCAMADNYFSEDFDNAERVYSVKGTKEPFPGYISFKMAKGTTDYPMAETVSNPDGDGNVLRLNIPAGSVLNADVDSGLYADGGATIKSGSVTYAFDMYIPQQLGGYEYISIRANNQHQILFQNSGTSTGLVAAVKNYPVGKWFTVEWTIDYTNQCGTAKIIVDGETYTVKNTYSGTVIDEGIKVMRISCEGKIGDNIGNGYTFYIDNIRYYEDSIEEFPMRETVYYNVCPDVLNIDSFAAGAVTRGGSNGSAKAEDVYCSAVGKRGIRITAPAGNTYHLDSASAVSGKARQFAPRTSGIQTLEFDLYIPEGSLADATDKFTISPTKDGKNPAFYLRLTGPDGDVNTTEALMNGTAMGDIRRHAVIGEEFKVRLVWNYASRLLEAYMVKNNGTVEYIGKCGINESDSFTVRGFRLTLDGSGASEVYVLGIKYGDLANMPQVLDFDSGEYKHDTVLRSGNYFTNAEMFFNGKSTVLDIFGAQDPADSSNTVLGFARTEGVSDSGAAYIETQMMPMTTGADLVTASADLYFEEPLTEGESFVMRPYISRNGLIKSNTYKLNEDWASIVGNAVTLTSDGIGVGNSVKCEYPIGEWFTVMAVYDLNAGIKTEYMTYADGTSVKLASAAMTEDAIESMRAYGVKLIRLQYGRDEGNPLTDIKNFYADNISIKSVAFGDTSLEYDAREESYIGRLEYSAKGDIRLDTQFIMAGYDADGRFVDSIIFNNENFYNGNRYYECELPVDEEGLTEDIKMMFWESADSLRPFMSTIK